MLNLLDDFFTARGERFRILPVSCMEKLEKDVHTIAYGEHSSKFTKMVAKFMYNTKLPQPGFDISSVIVAASPSPIIRIYFHIGKKRIPVIMPPTYMEWKRKFHEIEIGLSKELNERGYHIQATEKLPQKLLAVRSGLCQYGRNNVSYSNELGSFVRLTSFYSDILCEETSWQDLTQMASCRSCTLCADNCPTKAISAEHYLVDASKCLTAVNERAGKEFPEWIDASAHNAIVGCMKCQEVCPHNKKFLGTIIEPVEFTDEETAYILDDKPLDGAPSALLDKLNTLGVYDYYNVIPRNLKQLLNK